MKGSSNPVARALGPAHKPRIVVSKKVYTRKTRNQKEV
jgi:hypothetical protein